MGYVARAFNLGGEHAKAREICLRVLGHVGEADREYVLHFLTLELELAAADTAVGRDPLSVEALFTLAAVQRVSGDPGLARATLERAVRLQPSNPQTWMTLGRYQLAREPAAAVKELQAAIYLDPQSISPEAIAAGNREAIEVHNDYIQALEASARLRSASESRSRAAPGGLRGARPLPGLRSTQSRTGRAAP